MASETVTPEQQIFLQGPQPRHKDFIFVMRVLFDLIKGLGKFHSLGPCATVFGSARFTEGHEYYELARKAGTALAKMGFTVMTGGGPGIMEAANRGAKEAGGKSAGCNIRLESGQKNNSYLDKWVSIDYFFVRKVLLSKHSFAYIVLPGGYGTLDEFFEALTLIQTKKIKKFPIVLLGKKYHEKLHSCLQTMRQAGTIGEDDLHLFLFTDEISEMVSFLRENAIAKFHLEEKNHAGPRLLLKQNVTKEKPGT